MYGIFDLRIKKIKDSYKNKEEIYKKFGVFIFYNYFEKLDRFNMNFNLFIFLFSYTFLLFNVWVIGSIGEIFSVYSLFSILIILIEKTIYLKLIEIKIENVYENAYFISGCAIKDDLWGIIEFTTFNIDTLHLEVEKELKLLFSDDQ